MSKQEQLNTDIKIGGLLKFSTLDYPGKLSAVIFCQGCPNNCVYCHNPEFIPFKKYSAISFSEVKGFLEGRKGLLDAVVFSGGEPLMQKGLRNAIEEISSLGFKIGLHTSGANPKRFKEILHLVDWVGFDIKSTFDSYEEITQNSDSGMLARLSLVLLLEAGTDFEIRLTVDSRYLRFIKILNIAKMLRNFGIVKLVLQECILRDQNNLHIKFLNLYEIHELEKIINIEIRKQ